MSWFADYQARRAAIRFKPAGGKGTEICHTVNGCAMGWPRTIAAYLETHRQPDGSVAIVECLRRYLGGVEPSPPHSHGRAVSPSSGGWPRRATRG